MKMRLSVLAIATIGVLGCSGAAISASSSDVSPHVGTWQVNVEESIAAQGEVQKPYTVVMREMGDVMDFTFKTEKDGKPYEYSWKAESDGKVHELAPGITGSVLQLPDGNNQMTMWYEKNGMEEEQICNLQIGGNQLHCWATFTYPGGAVIFRKVVMDRVAGK